MAPRGAVTPWLGLTGLGWAGQTLGHGSRSSEQQQEVISALGLALACPALEHWAWHCYILYGDTSLALARLALEPWT